MDNGGMRSLRLHPNDGLSHDHQCSPKHSSSVRTAGTGMMISVQPHCHRLLYGRCCHDSSPPYKISAFEACCPLHRIPKTSKLPMCWRTINYFSHCHPPCVYKAKDRFKRCPALAACSSWSTGSVVQRSSGTESGTCPIHDPAPWAF